MVGDAGWATIALVLITASFPFYLYGAWIVIDADPVTWSVLTRHLRYILTGLLLTTLPVVAWMLPRLFDQFTGLAVVHAFLGLQAYALLVFALTGIVRILQAKRSADLYTNPDQDVDIDDLHENMSAWRGRLRIGVAGYVFFWMLAYLLGLGLFFRRHLLPILLGLS